MTFFNKLRIIAAKPLYFQLRQWCKEAGGDIEMNYIQKNPKAPLTAINDSNPFWIVFKRAIDEL